MDISNPVGISRPAVLCSLVVVSLALACSDAGVGDAGGSTDVGVSDDESTDESESDSGAEDSATGMSGFVPDVGDVGSCVPGDPDDCGADEKCTAYVMEPGYCCVDTNACVPITGSKQLGDDCTRTEMNDDCGNTLFCMTTTSGATGEGVCLQLCDQGNPTACADAGLADSVCTPFNDGILPLCEGSCDPLAQDCGMGWGCYPVGESFTCAGPAYDPGEGVDGSDCFTLQSCAPGLACASGAGLDGCNSDACCTAYCNTSSPGDECSAPEQCLAYFEVGMAPPGYETVGLCGLPA